MKTAVKTPWGVYFFKRLAMGLSRSAQTFQRVVEHVLDGLDGVFVYLDDMLVHTDKASHDAKLEEVFNRLKNAGLSISLDKCRFAKDKIDYLGYEVSEAGIRPLEKKVGCIKKFPTPTKQKELLHYLGAVNYFRASLGHLPAENEADKPRPAAEILMPLYSLGTCNIAKGTSDPRH